MKSPPENELPFLNVLANFPRGHLKLTFTKRPQMLTSFCITTATAQPVINATVGKHYLAEASNQERSHLHQSFRERYRISQTRRNTNGDTIRPIWYKASVIGKTNHPAYTRFHYDMEYAFHTLQSVLNPSSGIKSSVLWFVAYTTRKPINSLTSKLRPPVFLYLVWFDEHGLSPTSHVYTY